MKNTTKIGIAALAVIILLGLAFGTGLDPREKEPCGIDQTGQPGNCDRTNG